MHLKVVKGKPLYVAGQELREPRDLLKLYMVGEEMGKVNETESINRSSARSKWIKLLSKTRPEPSQRNH